MSAGVWGLQPSRQTAAGSGLCIIPIMEMQPGQRADPITRRDSWRHALERGRPRAPAPSPRPPCSAPTSQDTPVPGPPCWESPRWRWGAWGWLTCSDAWRADLSPKQSLPRSAPPRPDTWGSPHPHSHTFKLLECQRLQWGTFRSKTHPVSPREAGWETPGPWHSNAPPPPPPPGQARPPLPAPEPIPCHLVLFTAPLWSPDPWSS